MKLRGAENLHTGSPGAEHGFGLLQDRRLALVGAAVGRLNGHAEAIGDLGSGAADARPAVVADQRDTRAFQRRDHGGGEADDPGRAEHSQAQAIEPAAMLLVQQPFRTGDHRGGCGERAGWIGEQRNHERRHHRALCRLHHVERHQRVLAANENAGLRGELRRAREDRILDQAGNFLVIDLAIRQDGVEARIQRHVDVERADVPERTQHVQNMLVGHRDPPFGCGFGPAHDSGSAQARAPIGRQPRRRRLLPSRHD